MWLHTVLEKIVSLFLAPLAIGLFHAVIARDTVLLLALGGHFACQERKPVAPFRISVVARYEARFCGSWRCRCSCVCHLQFGNAGIRGAVT